MVNITFTMKREGLQRIMTDKIRVRPMKAMFTFEILMIPLAKTLLPTRKVT